MEKKALTIPGKKPGAYFSDAVQYGNLIFTSGTPAKDAEGKVVFTGDVVAQARFIFEKISRLLEAHGSSIKNIIRTTYYLRNMEDRVKLNDLRQELFAGSPPASTAVEVNKLAHEDLLIEIEVVAYIS
jgi:2-iminobutanoate/2-iminopropanoate deaminase